jgi:hypothetical protein
VNDEVPNGTPKTMIPSNGVVNWDEVLKWGDKLEGGHVTHYSKVGYKDLLHRAQSRNVHMQMIQ